MTKLEIPVISCIEREEENMKTRKAGCNEVLANGNICENTHSLSNGKCSVHWNEVKHTPTPWKASLRFQNNLPNDYVITDGKWGGIAIASSDNEANAAFIVRAVNSHEELLTALKIAVFELSVKSGDKNRIKNAVDRAKQAIIKAEGK